MGVDELAIQANEKGEAEHDTFQTLELNDNKVKIVKRSRVNNDIVVELEMGKEQIQLLQPGDREKRSIATSMSQGKHLEIQSSLVTINGLARVKDVRKLIQEEGTSVMVQELTIENAITHNVNTTVRYFVPYTNTPPHLESAEEQDMDEADS
jgi:hypothetical protein